MVSKKLAGIISVILGIIFLISPVGGVKAISMFSGVILALIGVWMVLNALKERYYRRLSLLWFIFAVLLIFVGAMLAFQIILIIAFAGFWLYVTGLLFIIAGFIVVFSAWDVYVTRTLGVMGILVGLIYFVVGILVFNPIFIGVIIGLILLIYGLIILFS
ncbi:MAG TPA: hypothetical protein HA298_06735 [Methanobacteriales archaeon]|jgi:hypothetical protein|nr:MAG: hypothetical protein XD44_0163 [Methanobacteriaceae archaeon 41_258]MBC7090043.1 DUF308 domain-containing protein [Methanobacteriaceae archaeon]MBC7097310.1 DUF308 domain-containing protein [Methanobacteriales archaeon]HIH62353.1 hypothetical protein [Methanobacteriales archaeon]